MSARSPRCRVLCVVVLVVACTLLPSCMTMTMWGFNYETDARGDSSWVYDWESSAEDRPDWWQRILLTPLTLAVDCLTWPLQCWLFADDDDDDACRPQRRRGC